jgi:hypothetical protein
METCIRVAKLFFGNVKQGLRTGVYGGMVGQTIATLLFVAALWVGAGLAQGFITVDELTAQPVETMRKLVEPTVRPALDWVAGQNGDGSSAASSSSM